MSFLTTSHYHFPDLLVFSLRLLFFAQTSQYVLILRHIEYPLLKGTMR